MSLGPKAAWAQARPAPCPRPTIVGPVLGERALGPMVIPMTFQPQTGRTERVAAVTRQAASADIAAAAALAMLHSGGDLEGWSERLREDLAASDRLLVVVGERDEVVAYGRVRRFPSHRLTLPRTSLPTATT